MKNLILTFGLLLSFTTFASDFLAEKQLKETKEALINQINSIEKMKISLYRQIDEINYTLSRIQVITPFKVIHELDYFYYVSGNQDTIGIQGYISGPDAYEGQLIELFYKGEIVAETMAEVDRTRIDSNTRIKYSFRPKIRKGTYLGRGYSVRITGVNRDYKDFSISCTLTDSKRCGINS